MVIAIPAFIGIAFYTIVGGFYLFGAFPFEGKNRHEIFDCIPRSVRRVGYVSAVSFVGCVLVGGLADLIVTLFR